MQSFKIHGLKSRLVLTLLFLCLGVGMLLSAPVSIVAQDSAPGIFATNTPQPSPAPVPDGYKELYALPQWIERDLLDMLVDYVQQLKSDNRQSQFAVQLIQRELEWRFPGAPHQQADRERVLDVMLTAPRGTVDMRTIVRPFIEEVLNRQDIRGLTTYKGFQIEISLINLNGVDPVDVIIHTKYPADAIFSADVLYEDYVLAVVDENGFYRMLDASPDIPAAPFGNIEKITLEEVGDVNQDRLEEMVLAVERNGAVNKSMLIYGLRNGVFLNLVAESTLEFNDVVAWSTNPVGLAVTRMRLESSAWGCLSQIEANYDYVSNYFRPVIVDPNRKYANQNSLACRLYEAEPLFSIPPSEAIETIEDILSQSSRDEPDSEYAVQRAEMVLAMLYALDGQPSTAVDMVNNLTLEAAPGSWLEGQASAFLSRMGSSGVTAVDLCAGLMAASDDGACDVKQVLARVFEENPLNRDEPVLDQLAARGLSVRDTTTISEIGHMDRLVVNFNLYGAGWWAFAPLKPGEYVAELVETPPDFEVVSALPAYVDVPQSAYDALLRDGDVTTVLSILDTAVQNHPGLPLSPGVRYLQALSYDLAADRVRARDTYFNLWKDFPMTQWGQLAAAHLERR